MITKETIGNFFQELKGNSEFDISQKLLWGYFFLDANKQKLKLLSHQLLILGFRYVDIFEAEKENANDAPEYYLHVERIEHHTSNSLFELNSVLYEMADKFEIANYDGFDLGNIINSESVVK